MNRTCFKELNGDESELYAGLVISKKSVQG